MQNPTQDRQPKIHPQPKKKGSTIQNNRKVRIISLNNTLKYPKIEGHKSIYNFYYCALIESQVNGMVFPSSNTPTHNQSNKHSRSLKPIIKISRESVKLHDLETNKAIT